MGLGDPEIRITFRGMSCYIHRNTYMFDTYAYATRMKGHNISHYVHF